MTKSPRSYTYTAVEVLQRPGAPAFYLLGAPAREIVRWADAPHKKVSLRAGYQRELEDRRLQAIRDFLVLSEKNILPSAALIAIRTEAMEIDRDGQSCRVTILLPEESATEQRTTLLGQLAARINSEDVDEVPIDDGTGNEEADPADPDMFETVPPDSYMASLYEELQRYDDLIPSRQAEMDEFVQTMMAPGLIIDGQHRIFGAKDVAGVDISIPLVLLPGLSVAEQVFNFYVLNNKAKPLDKRQLRSIIATSLTRNEIDDLYDRFRVSGLRADEAQWTYRVSTDDTSPFKNLISLKLAGDYAPIDDNIMDQIVGRFLRLPRTYDLLKKGTDWERDADYSARLELFYGLWRAIRDQYPTAWGAAAKGDHGAQFFQKVSLLQIQEYVLDVLKQVVAFQPESPFVSAQNLYEATTVALRRVPEDFFLKEWKRKGLDTNTGRAFFLEQLKKVAGADGKNLGNYALFRAE